MSRQLSSRSLGIAALSAILFPLASLGDVSSASDATGINFASLNFVVNIAKVPPGATASPSTCVVSGSTKRCTSALVINAANVLLPGVMIDRTNKLNGQISATCNIQASGQMSVTVPTNEPANGNFGDPTASLSGEQQCTFTANFGGSSISGSYEGSYSMNYQGGSGTQTANDTVTVVSGTGEFEGYVGGGTYSYAEPYTLHFGTNSSGPASGATGTSPGAAGAGGSGPGATATTQTPSQMTFPAGKVGQSYGVGFSDVQSITVASGSLPPGLSIQGTKIAGTPTTTGSYSFTLSITSGTSSRSVVGSITIATATTTTPSFPPGVPGTAPSSGSSPTGPSGASGAIRSSIRMDVTTSIGTMHLQLHKGSSNVVIVSPGSHLSKASDVGLLIATGVGKTCQATATLGVHKVQLGTGKVTSKSGKLLLRKAIRSALTPGLWTVTVHCGSTFTVKKVSVT